MDQGKVNGSVKNVNIDILTEQRSGGRKLLKIFQQAEGSLLIRDGSWFLTYTEPTDSRITPTLARLIIGKDHKVSLEKSGNESICMLFEEGKQHVSRLEVPGGSLNVGFLTNKLRMNIDENGGKIKLKYTVTAEDLSPVNTTMDFTISPK